MSYSDGLERTYRLRNETVRRVKALVVSYAVADSALVDLLLRYALDAVDAGRLPIQRRPATWTIDEAVTS